METSLWKIYCVWSNTGGATPWFKMQEHNSSLNQIILNVYVMAMLMPMKCHEIELLCSFHWHQHGGRTSYHKKQLLWWALNYNPNNLCYWRTKTNSGHIRNCGLCDQGVRCDKNVFFKLEQDVLSHLTIQQWSFICEIGKIWVKYTKSWSRIIAW